MAQTLGASPYAVTVRDASLVEVASLAGYESLSMTLVNNGVDTMTVTIPGEHPAAVAATADGAGVVIRPAGSGRVITSGQMVLSTREWTVTDGRWHDTVTLEYESDDHILRDSLCYAPTTVDVPTSSLSTGHSWSFGQPGPAESAIVSVVGANIGSNGNIARRAYPWFVVPPSQGRGADVHRRDRFNTVLDSVQKLATLGGLSFAVRHSAPGEVTLYIWEPEESPTARWSAEAGNLLGLTVTKRAPLMDEVVVAGENEAEERIFTRRSRTPDASGRRREVFLDQRQTEELAELREAADEDLEEGRARAGMSIQPVETPALRLGEHYNLGDIGTASFGGETITDRIEQVVINHQVGQAPSIVPSIGEPDPAETPAWLAPVRRLFRQLSPIRRI